MSHVKQYSFVSLRYARSAHQWREDGECFEHVDQPIKTKCLRLQNRFGSRTAHRGTPGTKRANAMNRTPIRGTICTHDVDHGDVYRNSSKDPKKYKILTNSTSANLLNLCQRERAVEHKHHNGQIHEAANGGAGAAESRVSQNARR